MADRDLGTEILDVPRSNFVAIDGSPRPLRADTAASLACNHVSLTDDGPTRGDGDTPGFSPNWRPERSCGPMLVVRCREGEFAAYVSTDIVLDSDPEEDSTPLRLRWDDSPAVEARGSISTSRQSVFIVGPVTFVNRGLVTSNRLRVQFHPYDSSARVASFNVAGFARYLPPFKKACPDAKLRLPGEPEPSDSVEPLPPPAHPG
jgi:hypothetical protein